MTSFFSRWERVIKGMDTMPEHKEWKDLPIVTQAAICCGEPTFWKFLEKIVHDESTTPSGLDRFSDEDLTIDTKHQAASTLRKLCGITSRRELATNDKAAEIFRKLDEDFSRWNKW